MSAVESPSAFVFSADNLDRAKKIVARYPAGRQQSALMPLLDLAQRQHGGWLPQAAIEYVAAYLRLPPIRAMEVASFYTMFNLQPVGRQFVQVCTTTPCWLRGSDEILAVCRKHLGIECGETSADGRFTLAEVECLGACVNAPMMQVGDDYYEDLTAETALAVLESLKRGEKPKAGPQNGRHSSEPSGGPTTLTSSVTKKEN